MDPSKKVKPRKEAMIKVDALTSQMQIVSYCGFSKKYLEIDEKTCLWLKRFFKKTKVEIIREGNKLSIPMEQLEKGDCIFEIGHFPKTLQKFTIETGNLGKSLKQHGIFRIKVRKREVPQTDSTAVINDAIEAIKLQTQKVPLQVERRKEAVRKTNELIQDVQENIDIRKEAGTAMEEFMDYARKGRINEQEITTYVEDIVQKSSVEALAALSSLKQSDQTYTHCIDVGALFQNCYCKLVDKKQTRNSFESKNRALLGAFLHDFGKSQIPKNILDSNLRYSRDSIEMQEIEKHPVYGAKILSNMNMPKSIVNMCLCHHVKKDSDVTSSYPKPLNYNQASYETRLLSIIDTYQALIGRRRYKRSWTPPSALRYIDALSDIEFEEKILNDFINTVGLYPIGSLVKLNDDSLAFVVNVPEQAIDKPQVVIVRNANGESTKNGTLIDLNVELDFHIKDDLDPMDVFGSEALSEFTNLNVC